uniref:Uncharacterized protein n=1 Tax=viral metagenome TaxID=1070528 RepID=A0A6C0LFL6_9ZZZZ
MQKESADNSDNNNNSIKELKEKIEAMEQTMISMDQKIDRLLELMEKDCKKMTDHIDFVEGVYESVKTPFTFIMDSVNRVVHPVLMQGPMQESMQGPMQGLIEEDVEDINI